MSEVAYSKEDFKVAREVFQKAIEYFKIPDEPPPESAKDFIGEDGRVDLSKLPLVTVKQGDNGMIFLSMAFVFDGIITVNADYSPVISILAFLTEARKLIKSRYPHWTDEDIEKQSQFEAFRMTTILISRIYPRMQLAMDSFIDEVMRAWFIDRRKWEAEVQSELGIKPILISEIKEFRSLLKWYEADLLKLWLKVPDSKLDEKKIQFAKEYPSVLKHWQKLREWCRKEDVDWREYAKAGKFLDTPDDLLDRLEHSTTDKTSHFALEHTARRAGIFKVTQDNKILEKRAQQIKVTGYTPRQLITFLKEGGGLLGEMGFEDAFHPDKETGESQESS